MKSIDYDNLSNIEIKNKIIDLNRSQLKLIRDSSYLIALGSNIKVREKIEILKTTDLNSSLVELDELYKYSDWIMNKLNESIEYDKDDIDTILTELTEVREKVYKLLQIVSGYQIELSYIGQIVDEHGIKIMSKKDYANMFYSSNDIEDLTKHIILSLEKVKGDFNKYTSIISEVVLSLPLRVVKENYFSILKSSIKRNLVKLNKFDIEKIIDDYKKQFDSSIRDGYGTKLDYYFIEIQKLRKIDLSKKSLEELDAIVADIIKLTMETNELFEIVFSIGLNLNKLIVGLLLTHIPVSPGVKDIIKDYLTTFVINKDSNATGKISNKIEKEINKIEKEINNSLDIFNKLNFEALNRKDFEDEELNEELLLTKQVLTIYNDVQLIDYNKILEVNEEVITDEILDQILDSLIQYINRSIINMSNIERKIRMRKLLSLIQLPFNNSDAFLDYIRYSLDEKILSTEEIGFRIDYINYFLEQNVN